MIEALSLNELYLEDALLYSVEMDLTKSTTTLLIEIDGAFHGGFKELGIAAEGEALIEFVLSGASAIVMRGLTMRPREWAPDEKPHDYEIATFRVSKRKFQSQRYRLEVECQLGQRCVIDFERAAIRNVAKPPGVTHPYIA